MAEDDFDPVAWVNRLIDVNADSQFQDWQKVLIARELRALRFRLESKAIIRERLKENIT